MKIAGLSFFIVIFCMVSSGNALKSQIQFQESSFYLKDVVFIDSETGWAVGKTHWDQKTKSWQGTMILTQDGGDSWDSKPLCTTESLNKLSFADGNTGWAVGESGTIIATKDGGATWNCTESPTSDDFTGVSFADRLNGWASTVRITHYNDFGYADDWKACVWHTDDGGENWYKQAFPENASILHDICFTSSDIGWAAGAKKIDDNQFGEAEHRAVLYSTKDGGKTWQECYAPDINVTFTAIEFVDSLYGWVTGFPTKSDMDGGFVFHTKDGGKTWERQEPGDFFATLWDIHFVDRKRGYTVGIDYISAWGPPVWRTMDGGASWEKVIMEKHDNEGILGIWIGDKRLVAVGDHDYMAVSTDPWGTYGWPHGENLFNQTYVNRHYMFYDIDCPTGTDCWVAGKYCDEPEQWGQIILNTNDQGLSWNNQYESAAGDVASPWFQLNDIHFVDSKTGWAVGSSRDKQGYIVHTSDGGLHWVLQGDSLYKNWDLIFQAVNFTDTMNGWALAESFFPSSNIHLAMTTDGGTSWSWVDTDLDGGGGMGVAGGSILGDLFFFDSTTGWAAGGLGQVIHTEDGVNWSKESLNCGYPSCLQRIYGIYFTDKNHGWLATQGLYSTTDGGTNWEPAKNISSTDFRDIQFLDTLNGWTAGDSGILLNTDNGGITWSSVESSTNHNLNALSFVEPSKGWIAGDHGIILFVSEELEVIPDIKANGSDSKVTVSSGDTAPSLLCTLDNTNFSNENCDCWIVSFNSAVGWSFYDFSAGWRSIGNNIELIRASYQGHLSDMSFSQIPVGTLSQGSTLFLFAVDFSMNGSIDSKFYYDFVEIYMINSN